MSDSQTPEQTPEQIVYERLAKWGEGWVVFWDELLSDPNDLDLRIYAMTEFAEAVVDFGPRAPGLTRFAFMVDSLWLPTTRSKIWVRISQIKHPERLAGPLLRRFALIRWANDLLAEARRHDRLGILPLDWVDKTLSP